MFHEREDLRAEIARLSKLPRCAARHPELRRQRGTSRARYGLRKLICVIQQRRRGRARARDDGGVALGNVRGRVIAREIFPRSQEQALEFPVAAVYLSRRSLYEGG